MITPAQQEILDNAKLQDLLLWHSELEEFSSNTQINHLKRAIRLKAKELQK